MGGRKPNAAGVTHTRRPRSSSPPRKYVARATAAPIIAPREGETARQGGLPGGSQGYTRGATSPVYARSKRDVRPRGIAQAAPVKILPRGYKRLVGEGHQVRCPGGELAPRENSCAVFTPERQKFAQAHK